MTYKYQILYDLTAGQYVCFEWDCAPSKQAIYSINKRRKLGALHASRDAYNRVVVVSCGLVYEPQAFDKLAFKKEYNDFFEKVGRDPTSSEAIAILTKKGIKSPNLKPWAMHNLKLAKKLCETK